MKPTISKPFKSNDRTFDKVYNAFDKRDYFNSQGLAKTQIGNFERALQKNDKGAQQVLDLFKGDEKKAKDYITQVISDRNKERAFNNYKALKSAVDSIQKGKPNVGAVDYVKRIIHNSSQKYSIALYSTLRNKKFTKWKDVHDDIDSLIGESVNELSDKDIKKAEQIRKSMPGFVGPKFAKKASNEDILAFADLQDKEAQIYNSKIKPIRDAKKKLYKKYGIRESVNEGISVFDERHFGKKGIIIMIDDNGKKVSAIFKDKKNADKFNRNKQSDIKKLLDLAKKTKFPKAIDESVNEAYVVLYAPKKGVKPVTTAAYKDKKDAEKWAKDLGGITMIVKKKVKGIDEGKKRYYQQDRVGSAKYTISYHDGKKKHKDGSDFFDIQTFKNKKDLAKFVNTLHKGGYVYGFNEEVPQGYNPMVEDKNQIKGLIKKVGKNETKFYDTLSTIEKKLGKRKYRIWLEKSLKDFGENPKHYDYRTNASAEEKLFQLGK